MVTDPTTLQFWLPEPSVAIGTALLTVFYLLCLARRREWFGVTEPIQRGQVAAFLLAMLTIVVTLLPGFDELGDRYSLLAHMCQHMALSLVMAPLFLLGIPGWLWAPLTRLPGMREVGRHMTRPLPAFLAFNVFFAIFHFPLVYEPTLHNRGLHIAVHLYVMASSVLMWWPVCSRSVDWPPIGRGWQIIYTGLMMGPMNMIGSFIALAPGVVYPTYARAARITGIPPLEDQQYAGMLMWVGGSFYIFLCATVIFFLWSAQEEEVERREQAERERQYEREREADAAAVAS